MQTVFSPRHAGHAGNVELMPGEIVPAFELPRRAEIIRARIEEVGLGPVVAPVAHELAVARRVHAPDYVDFLPRAWPMWAAAGRGGTRDALRLAGARAARRRAAGRHRRAARLLRFDGGATFVDGTWDAVKASHDVALSAAALVQGGAAPPSRSAGRPGTTPGRASPAATASSTTPPSPPSGCATQGAARVGDPRHRLPPRQRDAGDLLRARRCAGRQHPRRSAWWSIHISSAMPTSAARGRARASTSTCRCRTAPASPAGRRRWTIGCAAVAGLRARPRSWSRSASTPSASDPISRFRLETRRLPGDRRADPRARPADAVRDGGRLCGRGDRGQCGRGAEGFEAG